MIKAFCHGANEVLLDCPDADAYYSRRISVAEARRLAAELFVAAERAERLESDARAPG